MAAPPPAGRPTWAEIDLDALIRNYRNLQSLLEPVASPGSKPPRLIPVVKANAYGHGAVPVARALERGGATCFAVALVEEAAELRTAGIAAEILVLDGAWPGQEESIARYGLIPSLFSESAIERLEKAAGAVRTIVSVAVKIDTGLNRLGLPVRRLDSLLDALSAARHLRLAGVFSHLATADEEDPVFTREQTASFESAVAHIQARGFDSGELHLANSAGLLYHPEVRRYSARAGLALYGYPPARARSTVQLTPVLTLKTQIARIEEIPAGASVGYNRRYVAPRATRIATLPIGYADGYRRSLTGKGRVLINGRLADVVGAISMDLTVVDIGAFPEVEVGAEVVLLGPGVDAWQWAEHSATLPYEILCGIAARVPRVHTGMLYP